MIRRFSTFPTIFLSSRKPILPSSRFLAWTALRSANTSTAAFSAQSPTMPAKPHAFLPKDRVGLLDLSGLCSTMHEAEQKREAAYAASRKLQTAIVGAKSSMENGLDAQKDVEKMVMDVVGELADRKPREANLGYKVEDCVRYQALVQFFENGRLLAPSAAPYATDEEWLAGACMGLPQDLARYGLGRATVRDADSVCMAKDLVEVVLEYLLQFDFRNGPLRRKYDGVKYSLKSLEVLIYELAVTSTDGGEKPAKIQKLEPSDLLPMEELKALRERMEHRDSLRETLIKRCRDGQKAAKQAIFALHRQDAQRSKALLDQCEDIILKDLLPIVEEEPLLRHGSFSNLLEEYAEAKLFYAWLYGDATQVPETTSATPPARLLKQDDFAPVALEAAEYLGGLCDLTGEVGRFAVQRATQRDEEGVKLCLATNSAILTALRMMERFPREIQKKMDQLEKSVEKLERILYEMSLAEAAGGRQVQTSIMDMETEPKDADRDDN